MLIIASIVVTLISNNTNVYEMHIFSILSHVFYYVNVTSFRNILVNKLTKTRSFHLNLNIFLLAQYVVWKLCLLKYLFQLRKVHCYCSFQIQGSWAQLGYIYNIYRYSRSRSKDRLRRRDSRSSSKEKIKE